MILNLSESLAKPLVMAKLNMAYLSSLKNQQNCCRPTCRCHHLGYSVPPALRRTIWCRSTFGPRGPGLSNPTSFLRPALPMAPTRDDNARDKQSVLRLNPATFWVKQKIEIFLGSCMSNFCARRSVMMILNLSESLAKPLVMAKLNMAYLSSLKNQQNCCRPTCRCHHLGYSVPPALRRTIWCRSTFGPRGPGLSNPTSFLRPALPMAPARDDNARDKQSVLRLNPATFWVKQKIEIFLGSRMSKFLRPAQRYDDFKLIRITCQAACHGKTEHGIFVKFKKPAKLLSSYLPVSPSRVLRAPGTSPYHLVPKHLRTTWSRPEQSHLLPEACSPNGTGKRRQRQRQTERPPAWTQRHFGLNKKSKFF